jgi:hypothetical protein
MTLPVFSLHRPGPRWNFGRSDWEVKADRVSVSLPGAIRRFAGLWAERLDRTSAPNVNTPLETVSGTVGAVGGAKGNGERNCIAG